tara:strand:- start:147 stop:548 length:402 start_codon:yes stop_codon:yes gene_type:complete
MNKYSVLKLSNGEDIVCRIVEASKEKVKVEDPLLLDVQQITDKQGKIKESVGLIRWIKPFTEEEEYFIEKNSIVITVPASSGLSKYYEHVLKRLDKPVIRETLPDEIIKDDLDQMTDDEIIELMEDVKTRTIH